MKKVLIFIGIMMFLCQASVCAENIAIDSDIDFDNGIIKIYCTTEAKYNQALSVILYEGDTMGSDLSKIVKIADADADENGYAELELKLADDLPSGEYIISVSGGGSIKNSGSKVIVFVNKAELPQIIDEINSASQSDIKSTFENHGDIFTLPSDDGVYTQFLSLRKADSTTFASVNDIKSALKLSQLYYDINNNNSEANLLSYLKANAGALGIDTEDPDFKGSEAQVASAFMKLKKTKPLTGKDSFDKMWKEAMAIGVINGANAQSMTSAVTKYADIIGISKSEYEADCRKYSDVEINKALRDKNFESCQAIYNAYKNRISELSKKNNSSGGTSGGSSGGRSSGNSGSVVPSETGIVYVAPGESKSNFTEFTDLSEALWAEESVKRLAAAGIVSGYEDKTFKPNREVTREEFVTLIIRAFNMYSQNAECKFTDIKADDWCYKYVASAAEKKFVVGFEDGSFGRGSNISRQDAATILYRVGQANNIYFNDVEFDFTDGEEIAEYAKEAVGALNKSGVISGFEDGSFKPTEPLTRAQAVKIIDNMLNL